MMAGSWSCDCFRGLPFGGSSTFRCDVLPPLSSMEYMSRLSDELCAGSGARLAWLGRSHPWGAVVEAFYCLAEESSVFGSISVRAWLHALASQVVLNGGSLRS